jgi:DNA polymerase III delta prime subunit
MNDFFAKVDWKLYTGKFSWAVVWRAILLTGLLCVFIPIIHPLWNSYVVDPVLSRFPEGTLMNIFIAALIVYTIRQLVKYAENGSIPTINSAFISLWSVTFYLIFRLRISVGYEYYSYVGWGLPWLTYSDILFACLLSLSLDYKTFFKILDIQNRFSLAEDTADPAAYDDRYFRDDYAKELSKYINATTCKTSFSIAVVGEWGSGKTDFILRLKKELLSGNEVIEYNPWKAGNIENLIEDFFTELAKTLKKYNSSIAGKLRDYSKKLFQPSKELSQRSVDTLLNAFFKEETINEKHESLKQIIASTGRRLIVFIDDIDRLTGKETIEVLRLIRNTANFPNTFYIVALDNKYVVDAIRKTELLADEGNYLKKIFQLVITLPLIRHLDILTELRLYLKLDDMDSLEREPIEKALRLLSFDSNELNIPGVIRYSRQSKLENMLENTRDVKRFVNAFKIIYNQLHSEVDVTDLFTLELIRLKDIDIYQKLATKQFLKWDEKENHLEYTFDEERWTQYVEENKKQKSEKHLDILKTAVSFLLTDEQKTFRKVRNPKNFFLYFSYQLFDLASYKEFLEISSMPLQSSFAKFDEWFSSPKKESLINLMEFFDGFRNRDELKKYITTLLRYDRTSRVTSMLVRNRDITTKGFFDDDENQYRDFINALLLSEDITLFRRAQIAKEFFNSSVYNNFDILYPKKEWQKKILDLFEQHLSKTEGYNEETEKFFLFNDDSRDDKRRINLNPAVYPKMKAYLNAKNLNKTQFFRKLIRNSSSPPGLLSFVFFAKDIFGGVDEIKKEIAALDDNDPSIHQLKIIMQNNIQKVYHEKGTFSYPSKSDEYQFLMRHLHTEGLLTKYQYEEAKTGIFDINQWVE